MIAPQMASRPRLEGYQPREEVELLKQELGGAVAKRVLETGGDQAVAVATKALERERGTRDIAASPFEPLSLLGPAGHRRVQREAVAVYRGWRGRPHRGADSARRLQA